MNPTQTRGMLVLLAAVSFGSLQIAHAQEMPPRKPGLWKQTQYEGEKGDGQQPEVVYQCADEASDKQLQEMAKKMASCTEEPLKRKGNTMVGRNTCQIMGSKVTTDYVITGDMKTEYRVESRSKHEPPLFGKSQNKSVLVAEWQGPCKPGQKPGDMISQGEDGEETVNMNDLASGQDMSTAQELMQSQGMGQMLEQLQNMQPQADGAKVDMQQINKLMEQLQQLQKLQK